MLASRVIGAFKGTIDKLMALAALTPIIASVGGNTGNQTAAFVIRGRSISGPANLLRFLLKEVGIGLMNGVIWGTVVGPFALAIYAPARRPCPYAGSGRSFHVLDRVETERFVAAERA